MFRKSKLPDDHPIQFIYLERYGGEAVINYKSIPRGRLEPGKWYYLRAPRIFEEVLLPKLTHKLVDFAEIDRGFTTGANEFFYMKDITHLYEADYLANPEKFKAWGVNARTEKELREQGLIYIENGALDEKGHYHRFVIDKKDVIQIIKSPKEVTHFRIERPKFLCLYTHNPGIFTTKYIKWAMSYRHKKDNKIYNGFHERPTLKHRHPWYKLSELKPTNVLFPMLFMSRFFFAYSDEPILCDKMFYAVYPKSDKTALWLYVNSTIFFLTAEIYGMRMGGGALALNLKFYEDMPVPNLRILNIVFPAEKLLKRKPLPYYEEIKQPDRRELDKAVLRALGFPEHELDSLVDELYKAFVWLVEDRLIKSGRPQKVEEGVDGEDN